MSIKSPFNFVPLNDKVFIPKWADKISQDIPFEEGLSGKISLKITARSPIFIRNGHTKEDKEQGTREYNTFSHINVPGGKTIFFIPATSIKGEVRNLLEIMSLGKMTVDRSAMFARRDLKSKDIYPILDPKNQKSIRCGWLRRNGADYEVADCGRPMRISQPEIDQYLDANIMRSHFSKVNGINLNKSVNENGHTYDPKTAEYKNMLVEGYSLEGIHFAFDHRNRMGDEVVRIDPKGNILGTIVLTGQPSSWTEPRNKQAKGKYYEFVFRDDNKAKVYDIPKEKFEHFAFIYRDSAEWNRIKSLLNDEHGKGVPVFFRIEDGGIKDFGMAYLYKMPYNKSVYEALPAGHKTSSLDLAQCIFGYVNDDRAKDKADDFALKGRVQFGNAMSQNAVEEQPVTLILGSPKASYYPFYIQQDGRGGTTNIYKTYDNGKPSGWKRYHVRNSVWEKKMGSEKLDTTIVPLKTGATFDGTISFHNLLPVELGALLSALTFHNTKEAYHQLGQAKPYGYGKCTYDVELHVQQQEAGATPNSATYYMGLFEQEMDKFLGNEGWNELPQMAELFTMAMKPCADIQAFQYMQMSNERDKNEFQNAKNAKGFLSPATERLHTRFTPTTLISEEMKQEYQRQKQAKQEAELKREEEQKRGEMEAKKATTLKRIAGTTDKQQLELLKLQYEGIFANVQSIVSELNAAYEVQLKKLDSATASKGIEVFLPKVTSIGQCEGKVKKWLKTVGRDVLNSNETEYVFKFMPVLYKKGFNEKDKKKWAKLIGDAAADSWSEQLNNK